MFLFEIFEASIYHTLSVVIFCKNAKNGKNEKKNISDFRKIPKETTKGEMVDTDIEIILLSFVESRVKSSYQTIYFILNRKKCSMLGGCTYFWFELNKSKLNFNLIFDALSLDFPGKHSTSEL